MLLKEKVQQVDATFFQQLSENDILFIDSTHTVCVGSDVNYLYLEVLPLLEKGVIIHVHDIPFPYNYPYPETNVLDKLVFWQEPVLVQAFLMYNQAFEIMFCTSWLHFKHPDVLRTAFPRYDRSKHFPSSLWLRKVA